MDAMILRWINPKVLRLKKAISKFMRSISSSWKYVQSEQLSQENCRSEQEALSGKEKEEAVTMPLSYENSTEADFLWKLRKYVLLLATLVGSVTYPAVLSPPGGFWLGNGGSHLAAGDPVLEVTLFYFYLNVMAFFASVVTVNLLLVHSLSSRGRSRWWLRAPTVLDKLGFMGACAIGNKSACLRAGDSGKQSVEPEAPETVVERARRSLLILAILVAAVTYQAGISMSTPGGWLDDSQDDDDDHLVRGRHPYLSVALHYYCNITAFVASTVVVTISTTMTRHGLGSCALGCWVYKGAALVVLVSAFVISSSAIVKTARPVYATTALVTTSVLLYIGALQLVVPLCNHVDNWLRNVLAVKQSLVLHPLLGWIGAYAAAASRSSEESDPAAVAEDDAITRRKRREAICWHVACDAAHHMTGNLSLLQAGSFSSVYNNNNGEDILVVHPANSREPPLRVRGSGSVRTDSIALDDVWYVPGLDSNMVSAGQLARQGCAITLGPRGCRITRGDALVGSARFSDDGGYQFELDFLKVASSNSK